MKIQILQLIEGARRAQGLTVIIDVFRAFSTACYVFGNEAERIIPIGDIKEAYRLKQHHPEFLLIGERGGRQAHGFDYGNSPIQIVHGDFQGKTVIQTTSAGTQGIVNARQANEIITGSFCNAEAIVAYIRRRQPEQVSLVCMGNSAVKPAEEDTLCAEFLKDRLEGRNPDFDHTYVQLRTGPAGRRFFDPEMIWSPKQDFDLCLALNRFAFVLKVTTDEERIPSLHKIGTANSNSLPGTFST